MRPQPASRFSVWLWRTAFLGATILGAALPGCGGADDPAAVAGSDAPTVAAPLASIGNPTPNAEPAPKQHPEPPTGTPESLLHEAKLLRVKPYAGVTSPEKIDDARLARQRELVRLTTEVLSKTHDDPSKARVFDDAAFLLMDARLQLARSGDADNIDALYEHATAFHRRDPNSKAAAEAAYAVARFAHFQATKHKTKEWLGELARQAQVFATNFPRESRAVSLLYSAAWSCELHGLTKPATDCYAMIVDRFPAAEEAVTAAGSMRRLQLVGQPVQLGGSTLDGGHVSVDEFAGKRVLVLFWQAGNPNVAELMPQLTELKATYGDKLAILGVALDEDEATVQAFLDAHPLEWKQVFFADPGKRGWKNTVAEYYGVKSVPALWLIGEDGKVRSTNLTAETVGPAVTGRYGRMQLDVF